MARRVSMETHLPWPVRRMERMDRPDRGMSRSFSRAPSMVRLCLLEGWVVQGEEGISTPIAKDSTMLPERQAEGEEGTSSSQRRRK